MTARQQAERNGWTVDTHVYPWFAYKGPRFNPTLSMQIETDKESDRLNALCAARNRLQIAIDCIAREIP